MNKKITRLSLVTALLILSGFLGSTQTVSAQSRPARKLRLLYVTQSMGFRHQSLHKSEEIMEQLGHQYGFEVTLTQMAELKLTPTNIRNYDVIVFYTTGELPLSEEQKTLLLNWIKGGKFFMGIHSATDTF